MKILQHITTIALILFALPCSHALEHHHEHAHDEKPICASHTYACHACADELKSAQKKCAGGSNSVACPNLSTLLFVFSEAQPLPPMAPSSVVGILSSLQTVQLLI